MEVVRLHVLPTHSNESRLRYGSYNGEGSPEVDWFSLQATFLNEYTKADILMLIDCCRAGSAVRAPSSTESLGNVRILHKPPCETGHDMRPWLETRPGYMLT